MRTARAAGDARFFRFFEVCNAHTKGVHISLLRFAVKDATTSQIDRGACHRLLGFARVRCCFFANCFWGSHTESSEGGLAESVGWTAKPA